MADLLLHARWFTYQRQYLGQTASSMEEVLRNSIGVYSSHPSAPLTLWARTKQWTPQTFNALEQEYKAYRVHGQRGSVFLMLPADASAFYVLNSKLMKRSLADHLRRENILPAEFEMLSQKVLGLGAKPLLPKDIHAVVGFNGARAATILRALALRGDLIRVGAASLRSNQIRYAATTGRGLVWQENLDEPAILLDLAQRYLHAYGPARIDDFQWWLGITKARAIEAFARLDTVLLGEGLYLLTKDLEAFSRVAPIPEDRVDILPKWDSYIMGYASDGLARLVEPEMRHRIFVNNADGFGTVLVAGKVVGTWVHRFTGNRFEVSLDLFDAIGKPHLPAIEQRFAEIGTLLAGTTCHLTLSELPLVEIMNFPGMKRRQEPLFSES